MPEWLLLNCAVLGRDTAVAEIRKYVDCRELPSESDCSLKISGREHEVLAAAVHHAVSSHGHAETPELRAALRAALKDEQTVPSGVGEPTR